MQNEELRAENTRLTDLSRLLLSSPAFSTFLSELNTNGIPTLPSNEVQQQQPQVQPQPQQPAPQPQPKRTLKDVNPHQASAKIEQQGDAQISMAMIPETTIDFGNIDAMNPNWGSGIDFGMHNMQVFSVTELPDGPVFDAAALSEKPSATVEPVSLAPETKTSTPSIEAAPRPTEEAAAAPVEDTDMEFDESDPAFALFVDAPAKPAPAPIDDGVQLFGHIQPEKAFARLDLLVDDGTTAPADDDKEVNVDVMARFEMACASLDALSARIATVTSHLR